ncbi:S-layer homology domain-containing protein [Phosphitispora sp. TUW77]|uniref:S-layer homology domain-containing protein n=1 Tax=Phosphitispora sp. TUW77 TaxID=3152361 RepID=UPI003AB113EC
MTKKASLLLILIVTLVLSFMFQFSSWAGQFSDLTASHWAYDEINKLKQLGYINGYPDGTFKPEANITKAEFAAIMSRMAGDLYPEGNIYDNSRILANMNKAHWAYGAAKAMLSHMSGEDAQNIFGAGFYPEKKITREEVVAIIYAIIKQHTDFSDIEITNSRFSDISSARFVESINLCVQQGIINGYPDGTFKPVRNITRAEITAILIRVAEG